MNLSGITLNQLPTSPLKRALKSSIVGESLHTCMFFTVRSHCIEAVPQVPVSSALYAVVAAKSSMAPMRSVFKSIKSIPFCAHIIVHFFGFPAFP